MKLSLETDELVTGLSVSGSGNSWPGQSQGRALVRFCGWALYLEPPLCTVLLSPQVCLEGEISRQSILNSLSRGKKASGDLIPWTVSEQVKCFPWGVSGWGQGDAGDVGGCLLLLSYWLVPPSQFQDPDFGGLSGGRVVRIAVHPDYQGVTCLHAFKAGVLSLVSGVLLAIIRPGALGCLNRKLVKE